MSSAEYLRYLLTRSLSHPVTIERVSDEVLLNIFRYFLDPSPRDWPRLVHTCRKWRRIALASQEMLRLQLVCTPRKPVEKTLHFWPALPIVVEYGGLPTLDPPVPEDEDNIIAALQHSDRVISISLTVTSSLIEKLSAIEKPISELQDLVLLSSDGVPLTLPNTFRWGPRLRRLQSVGIALPALLQPLYSSSFTHILDLQLHDAFLPWEFSPVILKDVLSEMTQLRSLSLHFSSIALSIANYNFPPPPYGERVVLQALTRVNYRGSVAYLEGIVVIIDAPSLEDVEITFDNPSLALPEFKKLIDRIIMDRLHRGAHIASSEPTILMSLKWPGALMRLKLQSLSKPCLMQISSLAQISLNLSSLFWNDEGYDLRITMTRPSGRMDSSHSGKLFNPFTGDRSIHLRLDMNVVNHWTNIVHASQPRWHEHVLPAIDKLYIPQPGPLHVFLREAVVSAMISCRLSGHPIEVEYERPCDINEKSETGTAYDHCKDHFLLTWF